MYYHSQFQCPSHSEKAFFLDVNLNAERRKYLASCIMFIENE